MASAPPRLILPGSPEPVGIPPVPWTWVAHYADGTMLFEYAGAEQINAFAAIELERVVALALVPHRPGLASHVVKIRPGMRPIFFRRHYRGIGVAAPPSVTCLGWQRTVNGANVQSLCFLWEDGSMLLTDDRAAV